MEVTAWSDHLKRIAQSAFGTQKAAAAPLGCSSQGQVSKILNAAEQKDNKTAAYKIPDREVVDRFLEAVEKEGYQEENLVATTRRLYMNALQVVDPVKYQKYTAGDDRARAERALEAVIEALRQENAELADRNERLAAENERHRSDAEAFQAHAVEREREKGLRAEAERKIAALTDQLAVEREERVSSAGTIRALREELEVVREGLAAEQQARADEQRGAGERLVEARARLEELAQGAEAGLTQRQALEETVRSLEAEVAQYRAEEERREREAAVLAEAVAVTDQALHSSLEAVQGRAASARESRKAPVTVLIIGLVVALLGGCSTALSMKGHSLAAHSSVIAAFDHSSTAAWGGLIAAFVGVLLSFGGTMELMDNGTDTKDMCMATWI
ncbi:hypothetical protein ABT270_28005 [Streptomyces sp900105245]|uniref:hypothetical protein n=1 Tax=Streptomyces sp. 900105245 TaxID=3154379 RepID=UPI0033194231